MLQPNVCCRLDWRQDCVLVPPEPPDFNSSHHCCWHYREWSKFFRQGWLTFAKDPHHLVHASALHLLRLRPSQEEQARRRGACTYKSSSAGATAARHVAVQQCTLTATAVTSSKPTTLRRAGPVPQPVQRQSATELEQPGPLGWDHYASRNVLSSTSTTAAAIGRRLGRPKHV